MEISIVLRLYAWGTFRMTQQFDEEKWPELTRFRDACLADGYDEKQQIASRNHHWYKNENPEDLSMDNK